MKRAQLVFVTAIFTALLTGFLVERSNRRQGALEIDAAPMRHVPFSPLEPPLAQCTLRGSVLTFDGVPAANATVHLAPTGLASGEARPLHAARTDLAGRFRLEDVAAGLYDVVLLQPGHPTATFEVRLPSDAEIRWRLPAPFEPIPALPAMRRSPLEGRLQPPVGFTESDTPLEGYEIAFHPAPGTDPLSGATTRRAFADADGFFRVEDLVHATYEVRVVPPWATGGSWPVLEKTALVHGADPDRTASLALRLRSGEIQGRVVDVDRNPVQGALVRVWPLGDDGRIWPPTSTNANGWFRVPDLPPGSYQVQILAGATRRKVGTSVQVGTRPFLRFNDLDVRAGEGT